MPEDYRQYYDLEWYLFNTGRQDAAVYPKASSIQTSGNVPAKIMGDDDA